MRSDTPQGPGWWQAADGKWYPPESHPSRQAPAPGQTPPPGQPPAHGTVVPPPGYPAHPGYTAPAGYCAPPGYDQTPGSSGPAGYDQTSGSSAPPGYGSSPGSSAPPGYPPPATGYPPGWPGYPAYGAVPPGRPTNGLAVASLVCSVSGIVPFFFGITCVVGIVLGFVALGQIKATGGFQQGRGMALAGVIVGFSLIALFLLFVLAARLSTNQ